MVSHIARFLRVSAGPDWTAATELASCRAPASQSGVGVIRRSASSGQLATPPLSRASGCSWRPTPRPCLLGGNASAHRHAALERLVESAILHDREQRVAI